MNIWKIKKNLKEKEECERQCWILRKRKNCVKEKDEYNANEFEKKIKEYVYCMTIKKNLKNKREENMKKKEYESQIRYIDVKKTFKKRKSIK